MKWHFFIRSYNRLGEGSVRIYGPEETCKLCGRTMSVLSLTWHLRQSGTFGFQCVNENACKNARMREFVKEHPEI